MSAPAVPPYPSSDTPPLTLASRPFPRRVRRLLEGILEFAADELERVLNATLNDVEQQLFKLAEQARNNDVQQRCFEALRAVKRGRADVTPRFMIGLEAALAGIKDPPAPEHAHRLGVRRGELSLVDEVEIDETALLSEIASRAEIRNSLPLYLLGQRFGVLAGRPAFDAEHLPVGPQALCRILQQAANSMELNTEHRLLLFRQFDRQLSPVFGAFVEAINTFLVREGVLPRLTHVPVRTRPVTRVEPAAPQPVPGPAGGSAVPHPAGPHPIGGAQPGAHYAPPPGGPYPYTAWPGETAYAPPAEHGTGGDQANEMFAILRQLLAGRRQLAGKFGQPGNDRPREGAFVASQEDVQSVLGLLQQKPAASVLVDGQPAPRSINHVKQDLLAQLRQLAPAGMPAALTDEDADAIDLVGMLFDHIMKDVRPNSPAAVLLAKLQVPLLRVALRDKGFFTRQHHPARQMLNAIAESGAYWVGEDEADRGTIEKMQMLVERVVSEFNGDTTLFDVLVGDLGSHLQTSVHKAEVAERRHVEAARGKEKLALARMRASEAVAARVKGRKLPRFVHTLLTQAWSDALALTSLRQGEDSEQYARQLAIAERLVRATQASAKPEDALDAGEAEQLRHEIEQALAQVGYHVEDAGAIAARMVAGTDESTEDDAASRTELALRLKARARLGEDLAAEKRKAKATPLNEQEKACLDQVRHLPFGTWFEFVTGKDADRVRRRLSWYSTVTGHALFVNHRGQRVGEYTLEWLAQAMNAGKVRIVPAEKGTIIDRAWGAIMNALKSFSGAREDERGDTP